LGFAIRIQLQHSMRRQKFDSFFGIMAFAQLLIEPLRKNNILTTLVRSSNETDALINDALIFFV
jgi:hypothetical protein